MFGVPFLKPDVSPRVRSNLADIAVLLGTLGLLYLVERIGAGALVSFQPPANVPSVSLDPRYLPYHAGRSVLRMFVALVWFAVFTLVYGYAAALLGFAGVAQADVTVSETGRTFAEADIQTS
jgi:NitT/TauT family transport system permease protein